MKKLRRERGEKKMSQQIMDERIREMREKMRMSNIQRERGEYEWETLSLSVRECMSTAHIVVV
jgi:hypothetical protein